MLSLKNKNITFDFIYLFLFVFIFNILFLSAIYFIYNKPFIDESDFSTLTIAIFITHIFLIPLIEELCFRGVLGFSNNLFIVAIAISIVLIIYLKVNFFSLSIISLIMILGIFTLFNKDLTFRVKRLIDKNAILVIIITSILFSVAHLKNYDSMGVESWLKIIPRFTGGVYLGYIAYKYGISRSYFLHGVNNLIPFIVKYLAF